MRCANRASQTHENYRHSGYQTHEFPRSALLPQLGHASPHFAAMLREMTGLCIAAGEMNREFFEFRNLVEERAVDVKTRVA